MKFLRILDKVSSLNNLLAKQDVIKNQLVAAEKIMKVQHTLENVISVANEKGACNKSVESQEKQSLIDDNSEEDVNIGQLYDQSGISAKNPTDDHLSLKDFFGSFLEELAVFLRDPLCELKRALDDISKRIQSLNKSISSISLEFRNRRYRKRIRQYIKSISASSIDEDRIAIIGFTYELQLLTQFNQSYNERKTERGNPRKSQSYHCYG